MLPRAYCETKGDMTDWLIDYLFIYQGNIKAQNGLFLLVISKYTKTILYTLNKLINLTKTKL